MDPLIALRLDESKGNQYYDATLYKKIGQTAREYLNAGMSALNYAIPDFDAANDLVEMWQPILSMTDFKQLDRNAAWNFRHPATFTQMTTLSAAIAEILFGGKTARSVDATKDEDEQAAEAINSLLAWNDARLKIYYQGYLWVWASVVFNRGVWYESCDQDVQIEREEVEEDDFTREKEQQFDKKGNARTRNGQPVLGHPKRKRWRMKRSYTGFYNRLDLVSPYDFICDPGQPVCKMQEGRFAGHRVMIPWFELKRRSELDSSEDQYVLPHVVKKIKTQKGNTLTPAAMGGQQGLNSSRTYYDRQIRGASATGIGGVGSGLVAGSDAVNKDDGGTVECFSITIRAKPKNIGLYPDDEEAELITILITNQADILSVNLRPNQHDQYPYSVGEARPNAHRQFSPGWALAVKNVQDHMDHLNRVHTKAQDRMGNILLVDLTKCNVSSLTSNDKQGLIIERTLKGNGVPVEECVAQIPLKDTTENYPAEMKQWEDVMKETTGATSPIQGVPDDPSQTATQFDGTQQMAMGRMSSIARLLSEGAITEQTLRFVENFKQFMPDSMMIRVLGKGSEYDPDDSQEKFMLVKKADIQRAFTVVPHDGSLPGADAKTIAAAARAIESFSANPNLAMAFDNTVPGSLDPIRILRDMFKKSGLPVERFSVTREQALKNLQAKQMAQGGGMPQIQPVGAPTVAAPPPVDAAGIPSASILPPTPTAAPPPPGNDLPA